MGTDIHGFLESRRRLSQGWFRECEIDDSRNYVVFAVLADVRNGYGFAGVPTHQPLKPIAEPRGLPEDRTAGYGDDADGEFGDHSFSWLTLAEIADWPGWDQTLHEEGWIRREQYAAWLEHPGVPRGGWSGGVSGRSVVHADHAANQFPDGWTHVNVSWTRPLREPCATFLAWLDYAKAKVGDEREGRVVFGFDS
jgi:hypothetical protein